ncbi:uncharacterized protein LOC116597259 [Mustela erminea]|uniref:uncharacterized protein LOC116597259 n=1 Tax=Mustela erminea TaxID=36723 RepID=UPI001386DFBF|nr:uncharacterized protein LOC116597259 [Mustela erminea]XP_032210622.1 uncharacterized protein LOC116597259 [Mustela erminea]
MNSYFQLLANASPCPPFRSPPLQALPEDCPRASPAGHGPAPRRIPGPAAPSLRAAVRLERAASLAPWGTRAEQPVKKSTLKMHTFECLEDCEVFLSMISKCHILIMIVKIIELILKIKSQISVSKQVKIVWKTNGNINSLLTPMPLKTSLFSTEAVITNENQRHKKYDYSTVETLYYTAYVQMDQYCPQCIHTFVNSPRDHQLHHGRTVWSL